MIKGVIIKGIGGFYYVDTGRGVYECRARGVFRKRKITPLVGDYAGIDVTDENKKKGFLKEILPRKSFLIRPKVANVDLAVIVFAVKNPQPDTNLMDRFIVLAAERGLETAIVLNKTDLDPEGGYIPMKEMYEKAGFTVICHSAETGEGTEELKKLFADKVSVLAGPSGVGKSSLIMSLNPEMNLETGELSAKIERGRHTTRHTQLMEIFPGAFVVDSPGFSSLSILHIPPEELEKYFREFQPFLKNCRFNGCSHVNEEECGIREELGKAISEERYSHYVKFLEEIREERKYRYD
ncbi:MAG: ribosome small subunit-dependent GTPase A [Firmicutes bacterium]|nr:ribosome small subunit-dependent GTPase A [Bacillota bacterium]